MRYLIIRSLRLSMKQCTIRVVSYQLAIVGNHDALPEVVEYYRELIWDT